MELKHAQWVLAFDASCVRCASISRTVEEAGNGKLHLRPLGDDDVASWRSRAFDGEAPWVPTLFRVSGPNVRAWTGRAMALPLIRRLGFRSTLSVLRALGQYRGLEPVEGGHAVVSRAGFLKIGAGVAFAIGVLTVNGPTATAARNSAQDWVRANLDRLPDSLAEFSKYPLPYRRAIFSDLSAEGKSRLWSEHIAHFGRTRKLTHQQTAILDETLVVIRKEAIFQSDSSESESIEISRLHSRLQAVFESDDVRTIAHRLGGPDHADYRGLPPAADCSCNQDDDWCSCDGFCKNQSCTSSTSGCGTFWTKPCDGVCGPC